MLPAKSDVKNFGIQSDAVTFQREWKFDCASATYVRSMTAFG